MRIYIANLGKYNEGELVGAWFTPPVDFEEVKERIGLNDEYEEYAIHDYELPFAIDEYTPIEEVNRLCEMVEDLPEYIQEELSELQSYFGSIEELCEHEDDIICHSGCDDMADVARCYLEESGQLGELPTMPPMGVTWNWREPLLSQTTAYMKSYGRPVCISFRKYRRLF
jgi:antirestriction protein